jgi:hypothetical protein
VEVSAAEITWQTSESWCESARCDAVLAGWQNQAVRRLAKRSPVIYRRALAFFQEFTVFLEAWTSFGSEFRQLHLTSVAPSGETLVQLSLFVFVVKLPSYRPPGG